MKDMRTTTVGLAVLKCAISRSITDAKCININLWGVIHGTAAAYAAMLRQGSGHIVNAAAAAGLIGEARPDALFLDEERHSGSIDSLARGGGRFRRARQRDLTRICGHCYLRKRYRGQDR